jgi:transcriptional regulator with XRE-family HTH domain
MDISKTGNQIAWLRREKGLTGEKLAEALGVSPQAVSKWENGRCLPETALLPALAEALSVRIDAILKPDDTAPAFQPIEREGFALLGAWYGRGANQRDVMYKMRHYDYFRWDKIHVNHETFPSSPGAEGPDTLTLVYRNAAGVHTISCEEGGALCYIDGGTALALEDGARCILPGIPPLQWEHGMDCCWAGAATLALQHMGEPYSYEQIMGLSGACYRLNFVDVWDWSATDALVAFDYTTPLFRAIGRENIFACRLEPEQRPAERQRIVEDLRRGRPVIAINLRVAPEWGVITGFADNGKTFYCRTYFDQDHPSEKQDGQQGYPESENWPFLIQHFGDKTGQPCDLENLRASLRTLIASFEAPCERGYYQGREAYQMWAMGLLNEKLWTKSLKNKKEDIRRRLGVNESMLLNLVDARRCAAAYLRESAALLPGVEELAAGYEDIYTHLRDFREKLHNWDCGDEYLCDEGKHHFVNIPAARSEQADLLAWALEREARIVENARLVRGEQTS